MASSSPYVAEAAGLISGFVIGPSMLALPINIIAGLLGMNVGGLPLAPHPHGFRVVVAIVVSITSIAAWFVFRRRRDR